MDVKIAIVGAGSATFAAGIVRDIAVNGGLCGSHVALMDVDERRLDMITRMAERLNGELDAGLTFSKTLDREAALSGADFVLNTAQVGGHPWVEEQRRMTEAHAYYRGAHLHGFGQAAFMREVARHMERVCPDAWLIQSANPVFEGCTLMHRETDIKVLGLCHGHYGYHGIARVLGLELDKVSAVMPGFNHWIWMTDFRYEGRNAYPLLDEWIETKAEKYWSADARGEHHFTDAQMTRAAIHQYKLYGLMPIGDTPRQAGWWYQRDLETKVRWYNKFGGFDSEIGWGMYLEDIAGSVAKVERAALDEEKPICETFEPVQSGEQIVPIIDSLVNDKRATYQVNIPNTGHLIEGFPEDLVVECEGIVDGSGVRGVRAPRLPRKVMVGALIPRWHRAEMMVEALVSGDRDVLLHYVLNDARTQSFEQAERMLSQWLAHPKNADVAKLFPRGGVLSTGATAAD